MLDEKLQKKRNKIQNLRSESLKLREESNELRGKIEKLEYEKKKLDMGNYIARTAALVPVKSEDVTVKRVKHETDNVDG